jgi:hypothetical protein
VKTKTVTFLIITSIISFLAGLLLNIRNPKYTMTPSKYLYGNGKEQPMVFRMNNRTGEIDYWDLPNNYSTKRRFLDETIDSQ